MAKPNLTSIFTSTNQYSVLKLLKALCDAVDNIDYADNTEFTNFKEQVNTAVASLTSTDNSLEQSIMNNENAISDLNTVTSNNYTEINSIKNKISGINTDASGNVTVGKNLEVSGTTKLNGGLEPIHHYESIDGTGSSIDVYFDTTSGDYHYFMGKCNDGFAIGAYTLEGGKLSTYTIISVSDPFDTVAYMYVKGTDTGEVYYPLANKDETQPKLYRHIISLSASSSSDGTCRLEWISSSNLNCDSLQDLRTLLNNPPMQSYVASNPSGDLFGVVISPSTAQIKKVGTSSLLNITSVLDTVTPL